MGNELPILYGTCGPVCPHYGTWGGGRSSSPSSTCSYDGKRVGIGDDCRVMYKRLADKGLSGAEFHFEGGRRKKVFFDDALSFEFVA